jgi:peroxiredoxin
MDVERGRRRLQNLEDSIVMCGTLLVVLATLTGQAPTGDPASSLSGSFSALKVALDANLREYKEAHERATSDEERAQAGARYRASARSLADRALALAGGRRDDPQAIDVLLWIIMELRHGAGDAFLSLGRDHVTNERLIEACRAANFAPPDAFERVEAFLHEAESRSPHRTVRGFAGFYLAKALIKRASTLRRAAGEADLAADLERDLGADSLARFRARPVDDLEREAEQSLERVTAQYGDLETLRKQPLRVLAQGELFALRRTTIGKEAPEIEGEDAEGRPFKLSDHRGKVVVLTFSGNWCGPCVAMYPQERAMVEGHRGRPFALLSVNTDADRTTLREAIGKGEITWPCWWDGGPSGPITLRWGIDRFPSVFVLDHKGVIRHRDLRGEALDRAVDQMIQEMGTGVRP